MARRRASGVRKVEARYRTYLSRTALCRIAKISEGQLRLWEEEQLLVPARVVELDGEREPLYTSDALDRIRIIRTLSEELQVNLPGIDVILNLLDRLAG